MSQAEAAAALLRNRGIRTVVSSPLDRARHTARIVGEALGLPVAVEPDLREVSFGVQEGQPMGDWFHGWIDGRFTPDGAEPFIQLRHRAVGAVNRALEGTAPVLVVAHGGLFRALRDAMGVSRHERTPNAAPFFCEPGPPWTLTAYA